MNSDNEDCHANTVTQLKHTHEGDVMYTDKHVDMHCCAS